MDEQLDIFEENKPSFELLSPQSPQISANNDDLSSLLKSWNLYDELYNFMKGKKIGIECLKYMKERHIDQLFSELDDFNLKVIFEHKLTIWQKINGIYNLCQPPQLIMSRQMLSDDSGVKNLSSTITSNISETDITVADILNRTEQGRIIIQSYQAKQHLTPYERTKIVHKIVQHFTENGERISVKKCEALAHEIVQLFPKENISSYFVPGKNKTPPKGKLYDRYRGQSRPRSKFNKDEEVAPKKRKTICDTIPESNAGKSLTEDELINLRTALKHNRNWETVVHQWIETAQYRRKMIIENKDKNISSILHEWPLYKSPRAQELIKMDFKCLAPHSDFNFKKWHKFCNISLDFYSNRIKAKFLKTYLQDLSKTEEGLDIDNKNIAVTKLLHGILPPTSKQVCGKLKKFTIEDSIDSFSLEVADVSQIETVLKTKSEKSSTHVQPSIIIVGEKFNYTSFYVLLDDVKFQMQSYLDCIDLYFKMVFVLNIPYPQQCLSVCTFFQKYFFNIEQGEEIPSVQTLITDLEFTLMEK